jgi:hypothetical protein
MIAAYVCRTDSNVCTTFFQKVWEERGKDVFGGLSSFLGQRMEGARKVTEQYIGRLLGLIDCK